MKRSSTMGKKRLYSRIEQNLSIMRYVQSIYYILRPASANLESVSLRQVEFNEI